MAGRADVPTDVGFSWQRAEEVLAGASPDAVMSRFDDELARIGREAVEVAVQLMSAAQADVQPPRRWRGLSR
jgi:hypothetical protein